jgi:gamma-glutamyltranspeptidase / glutathione hydrolase
MKSARAAADALRRGRLALAFLVLITSIIALAAVVPGAGATGEDPYSLEAEALFSPEATDLTLRVDGPIQPSVLEMVQVKAWPRGGGEPQTQLFFDVPLEDWATTIPLSGRARGERLEVRAHLDVRPQHNLDAETTVLRRPDLTVTEVVVPDDVVRTRGFDVTAMVAEVGGDTGALARVELRDGDTLLASTDVVIAAGETVPLSFPIVLAHPGNHTLSVNVNDSDPEEWDVAPNTRERALYVNRYGADGVVATDHPLATQVGVEVLRSGGNAIDAAAAIQFVLNVTQPHLTGIGGSSNVIVRDGETGEVTAIDAREMAPAATTSETYRGLMKREVGPNGYAVGVPGTLRAVEYMLDRWGTRSLSESLQPAIGIAENGFSVGHFLAFSLTDPLQRARAYPETNALFHRSDGTNLREGDLLVQADLARTFRLLAQEGTSVFYEGEIAEAIVAAQRRATTAGREGRMTLDDLAAYSIDVEDPLELRYGNYDVLGPGPSTNGGVVVLESLGLMREFLADPDNAGYPWGFGTRNSLHVFLEAMRLAFADRDMWIGDERFSNVPASLLLDDDYLRDRSSLIGRETVMCSPVAPGNPFAYGDPPSAVEVTAEEEGHTSHFSIIDRWGNAVVMTSTLADAFGSGIMVPGYGFLLNDSLVLFNLPNPTADPSTGNPGANDAAGGKRPMGSMAPTLIMRDGEPFMGTGTYGGDFIPSVVLNVVLNVLEYDMPLQAAVDAPRMWAAVSNGDAAVNPGFAHLILPLRAMGHRGRATGGCAGAVSQTPSGGTSLGSTGSFGVNLSDFGLAGGEDSARFPDARTTVVERN